MEPESVSDARKAAEASFVSGLYCAESVVLTLSKAQGIESELLPRVATAFCGGMGHTSGTCGAFTGAMMGISLALGRSDAAESAQPAYDAVQRLVQEFEQEFGSRECTVLLGCDLGTPEGREIFRQNGLRKRCARITGKATEIAARIIADR